LDDEAWSPTPLIVNRLASSPAHLVTASLLLLTGCANRPASQSQSVPAELRAPPRPAPPSPLTLASSIEAICATPAGKAVLDRDLPGLTARPEFDMFKAMTLKQLQPMSRGHITDTVLAKVAGDLKALNAEADAK